MAPTELTYNDTRQQTTTSKLTDLFTIAIPP